MAYSLTRRHRLHRDMKDLQQLLYHSARSHNQPL